jgi:thiamine biosynthesis lipoprotein
LSASIISKSCITSDATATGILVMGLEKAKIYFNNHPELQALLIYSDEEGNYQLFETKDLKTILTEIK